MIISIRTESEKTDLDGIIILFSGYYKQMNVKQMQSTQSIHLQIHHRADNVLAITQIPKTVTATVTDSWKPSAKKCSVISTRFFSLNHLYLSPSLILYFKIL